MAPTVGERRWTDGLGALLIVVGSWLMGPAFLVSWAAAMLYAGDYWSALVLPAYFAMFKLQKRHLRVAFWVAFTAVSATRPMRLAYAIFVWGFAGIVLLDVVMPSWPGYVDFMHGRLRLQAWTDTCTLGGSLESIKPERTVFAFHPHGAVSYGFTANGMFNPGFLKRSKKVTWLIDGFLRYGNPPFRFFCDLYRTPDREIRDASGETLTELMAAGSNVALILGGFEEATLAERGKDRVVVGSRKGIIKHCLRHGYRIQPVYTFGEDETYHYAPGFLGLRLFLNRYKVPAIAFVGNPWICFLPRKEARVMTFVGEPVDVPKIEAPTAADVDAWHARYVESLKALFEKRKAEAGRPSAVLEVY